MGTNYLSENLFRLLQTAAEDVSCQPRSQSSSAISDVTSPVKLVGKIRTRFQASSGNSDSANWAGYKTGSDVGG